LIECMTRSRGHPIRRFVSDVLVVLWLFKCLFLDELIFLSQPHPKRLPLGNR